MATWITAECPSCKVKTLDVQVGRKSTVRSTRCALCGHVYEYSCWPLPSKVEGVTLHQVDLVPLWREK